VTGVFSGLLGIGGGAIVVPAMVYLLKSRQHEAHGTSLVVMIPIAVVGAVILGRSHDVDVPVGAAVAAGAMGGAVLGARLAQRLSAVALRRAFGLAVLSIAFLMIGTLVSQGLALGLPAHALVRSGLPLLLGLAAVVGIVTGVLSGLLGIGGGIVMVPAMVLVLGLTQHLAQGTSLAVIIPTALAGSMAHLRLGNIRFDLAVTVSAGGILGAALGALVGVMASDQMLMVLFAAYLLVTGVIMVGAERPARLALKRHPTMSDR